MNKCCITWMGSLESLLMFAIDRKAGFVKIEFDTGHDDRGQNPQPDKVYLDFAEWSHLQKFLNDYSNSAFPNDHVVDQLEEEPKDMNRPRAQMEMPPLVSTRDLIFKELVDIVQALQKDVAGIKRVLNLV